MTTHGPYARPHMLEEVEVRGTERNARCVCGVRSGWRPTVRAAVEDHLTHRTEATQPVPGAERNKRWRANA